MKMTWSLKKHEEFKKCKTSYVIDYVTPSGKGHMMVKTNYYDQFIKKFTKAFSDAVIVSFVEVSE